MYTLQLNADYTPRKLLRWERAVELVLVEKAVIVTAWPGRFVRSPSLVMPWPAVVALRRYAVIRGKARFSRRNVHARDGWTCMYCGIRSVTADGRPERSHLTIDHVIPRAQARNGTVYSPWARRQVHLTSWENVVTACMSCNHRKADHTPAQAGMTLRAIPRVPTQADALRIVLSRVRSVPPEWEPYLPPQVLQWHREEGSGDDERAASRR